MINFDANGNPAVEGFQKPNEPASGNPTPNDNGELIKALMLQNQQLQAQMGQLTQVVSQQQQTQNAPQPPAMPEEFNPHDLYNVETPTGKWMKANSEYERNLLLADVGGVIKQEVGSVKQANQFDQTIQQLASTKNMSLEDVQKFKQFLDNPQADMNVLYEVYRAKNTTTTPPAVQEIPGLPGNPPQNIPTPQPVTGNPGGLPTGQAAPIAPPPINQVSAGDQGASPPPSFAEIAAKVGYK